MKKELKELTDYMDSMADAILAGMDRGFERLNTRMDNFEERLTPLEQKVSNDDLTAGLAAIDKYAILLIDHHKRIGRLEKRIA